ncbi:MAG: GNAT family N-acetyltransferase [Clostridiales bacterium]|nr:GNAT family N-acetyltransferase [Clostridiales bacterium]MCD8367887.1 GNAT family N-acetyltransferase [Clostridiales bacterium]
MATMKERLLPLLAEMEPGNILFRPVEDDEDIWYAVEGCQLTPEQQECVNSGGFSLGRAYLHPERSLPCLICRPDGERIGFILFTEWLGEGEASSWSYFIDVRHQGQGFGKAAAQKAVELLKRAYPDRPVKLSTEVFNRRAQALYISIGFRQLDELDGDDLVFAL